MKKSTFTPQQIATILKEFDAGKSAEQIQREHGVSKAALYKWRQRYGGMEASELKWIKELEEENARLKRMYANLAMELDAANTLSKKSCKALRKAAHHKRGAPGTAPRHRQGVSPAKNKPQCGGLSVQKRR